jgi:hypothetical protein
MTILVYVNTAKVGDPERLSKRIWNSEREPGMAPAKKSMGQVRPGASLPG